MYSILRLRFVVVVMLICGVGAAQVAAEDAQPINLSTLGRGASSFPFIWRPYRQKPLPPVNLRNGSRLARHLAGGTLRLSLRDFLQLVVENDLTLHAARYGAAIAEVDLLRAVSGQAARGTSDAPLPGSLFAGAIGAGVSTTAPLSPGGTGGAAISSQGRLFTLGPRGNFDPTFSANLSYDHVVSPLNTIRVAGAARVTVPSTVLQTRYQQELADGTSYAVSFNLQRQSSSQTGLLFNPATSSFFAFQVFQPVLNGFGVALNRRFVTVARNNRKIVLESYHSTLNNTLASAADAYWDLIALRENVRVAAQSVTTAQQQYDEYRQRVELDVATPLDLLGTESRLASARVALLAARTRVQQQEALIKTLISRADDPALDAAAVEPTDVLPGPADIDVPPLSTSVVAALTNRSAIREASLRLQNQEIAQEYTRKNLLPTLSVYAAYDAYALGPRTSPAIRQLWESAYPEYSAGFTLSVPVFNRAAQADDVRARLERQSAEVTLQRTKTQIETQVKTATISLERGRSQIEAAHRAVASSQTAFEGAQAKLELGVATPYQVTLAERDLRSAQSAEIQARVNYAKALVAHEVAVSDFLEKNGIVFDDALRGDLFSGPLPELASQH